MIHILNVVGARPNFMKIAPILREIYLRPVFCQTLVHTGQHYDPNLSDVFFTELGIQHANINLGVGSMPREEQIERIMVAFEPYLVDLRPDIVLVVGDINSTVACARVAKRHGAKIAHVEAGLRSFDLGMPEEQNRLETDQLSDFLFVTEQSGVDNLRNENCHGSVFLVGNVMIDTLITNLDKVKTSRAMQILNLQCKEFAISTFHRPSNVDSREGLKSLIDIISSITERIPMVLPIHPRTRCSLEKMGLLASLESIPRLKVIDPLGYLDFMHLVANARVVITDSGGIQEETTYLQVPCLTMRENTERPITVDEGSNTLVGLNKEKILFALDRVIDGTYKQGRIPQLWDGKAAYRILNILESCEDIDAI